MKFGIAFFGFILALSASGKPPLEEPKIVEKVTPLPVAFDKDFEFRKTKLFFLSEKGQPTSGSARQTTSTLHSKSTSPSQKLRPFRTRRSLLSASIGSSAPSPGWISASGSVITSISFGGPNVPPMSQCAWSIARKNYTNTCKDRRLRTGTYVALIRRNSRLLETTILTTAV